MSSESSSGVGSLGSAVSKEVCEEIESRNVGRVEVLDTVREPVVLDGLRVLRALDTGRVSESERGVVSRSGGDTVLK